ncbi:very short patch repair endonuclease [Streptomyces sp. NPDC001601]|uniref:very short patch repair endonuclease n=1 Tax=Streptomyces sp. NPDC001601 TaxID=3364592 RepID=UPI0036B23768
MPRDPQVTSRIMSAVRAKNTRPEIALRKALWRLGLRYRLHVALEGRPDITFVSAKVAVFVDGDFWHGNAWRVRGMKSFDEQFERINNKDFWRQKITRNMERDARVTEALTEKGWTVYRVFESRLKSDFSNVVAEIEFLVRRSDSLDAHEPDAQGKK